MSTKTKLLPCLFCGGEAEIIITDDEGNMRDISYVDDPYSGLQYGILHDSPNCMCHHEDSYTCPSFDTEEEAIAMWNKRPESEMELLEVDLTEDTQKSLAARLFANLHAQTINHDYNDETIKGAASAAYYHAAIFEKEYKRLVDLDSYHTT